MPLQSKEFSGDPRLEACAVSDSSHVMPGATGAFVGKIQQALIRLGAGAISADELSKMRYGPSTASSVRSFKTARRILNYAGRIDDIVGKKTIAALDQELASLRPLPPPPVPHPPVPPPPPPPPGPPKVFVVHDVRLFGWKPLGDVLEVNGDTPLQWMIDNVVKRGDAAGGNLTLKIMSHGLPGFVQCCRGAFQHPTLPTRVVDPKKGNLYIGPGKGGICRTDLAQLEQLRGKVKRIEFHSCLVARIGPCSEANGHASYDGNEFCYQLAQRTAAEVAASIHLQFYWEGTQPGGMHFGNWNGLRFTWGPAGNIIETKQFAYNELTGPPPPGTPAT